MAKGQRMIRADEILVKGIFEKIRVRKTFFKEWNNPISYVIFNLIRLRKIYRKGG